MDLKKLSGLRIEDSKEETFESLKQKFLEIYYKENLNGEPGSDGTILIDFETGKELGFTISNQGWESKYVNKFTRLAKKSKTVSNAGNISGDLVILPIDVYNWMNSTHSKLEDLSDEIENDEEPTTKISREDFDKFLRWSDITGLFKYHDYDYSDVKEYIR